MQNFGSFAPHASQSLRLVGNEVVDLSTMNEPRGRVITLPMPNRCVPKFYLQNGGDLRGLWDIYKVTSKRHSVHQNLVQLKYDQIEANFNLPLVTQCRGLILNEADNWAIVARPFDKFFNYGEELADPIDWKTATINEKLDGSLIIMYYHEGAWWVATSGTPDGSGDVGNFGRSFASLFWEIWDAKKYRLPSEMYESCTFMFELTSPFNRVVVQNTDSTVRLIGVRNNLSGLELPIRKFAQWERAREFPPMHSIESLAKTFDTMNPVKQEGYVVVDAEYRRIKVKHPGYVALHHMRSSLSPKRLLQVVRAGEIAEVVASFPEWQEAFERIKARYDGLVVNLEQRWEETKHIVPKKLFAESAKKCMVPGILFSLYDQHIETAEEGLRSMHIEKLAELLAINEALEGLQLNTI